MNPPTVLVVDDERHILHLLELTLRDDFQVFTASNGIDALAKALELRPQMVVLDVMLPGLSGIEVAQALKKEPSFLDTPVVFLTARTDLMDELSPVLAGAMDVIFKPFDLEELPKRLLDILNRHEDEPRPNPV